MKVFNVVLLFSILTFDCFSQNEKIVFGQVSSADVELKECSFEKDAHAMILFDIGNIYFNDAFEIIFEHHKRIKLFSEKAKDEGNIRIEYYSTSKLEDVYDITAHTINVKDGKQVITKLDRKQIFYEKVDKNWSAVVFSLPDVQEGSIIEYKYKKKTWALSNFPDWTFQHQIPSRYSELKTSVPDLLFYRPHFKMSRPFDVTKKSSTAKWMNVQGESVGYNVDVNLYGLNDIPALKFEPYMTSFKDNYYSVVYQLTSVKPVFGMTRSYNDTWGKIGANVMEDEDFGLQLKKKLTNEEELVKMAKALPNDDAKIAFLFNEVKKNMKWDGTDKYYTNEGVVKAWDKKIGNSTEINLILYRLLNQSGVRAYPMLSSTRDRARPNIAYPSLYNFNRAVVYIPVDSTANYILDASNKYNIYNVLPLNILNSYGLMIDRESKGVDMIFITDNKPVLKSVYIKADILADGKMLGNATLAAFGYHKVNHCEVIKADEAKYLEQLKAQDNNLKIGKLEVKFAEVDSLPLTELIDFEMELTGSEGDYIYFNANLFSGFAKNPFLNEARSTTIDLGFNNRFMLTGSFKIPEGFKVEYIPKSQQYVMPDKSVSFQTIAKETNGVISLRYLIQFNKSLFTTDDYPLIRQFYKEMYERINEQIVLKKS